MDAMALYDGPRGGRATLLAATLGIGVAGAVSAARSTGWLEGLELAGYDRLVRWQAEGEPSQRVAVVRIREQDLARYGHPLPDAVLVRALERIAEQSPRAIGVDLYRTEPPPGDSRRAFETLGAAFRRDSRLVLIEKLPQDDDPGFPAPRFAAGTDQVGFSDVVIDSDGVVRRGLLILWDDAQRSSLSFSLQLALRYLRAEGISLAPDPERPEHVRLGATSIPALESTTGAYVSADARGYQFLQDFRPGRDGLPTYDLPDLLEGRLPAAALRDRVVVLGTTSRSVKDDFVTAHSAG